jgi:hypothetical protein
MTSVRNDIGTIFKKILPMLSKPNLNHHSNPGAMLSPFCKLAQPACRVQNKGHIVWFDGSCPPSLLTHPPLSGWPPQTERHINAIS